ncbi:UvrD-helicase domain-containing protein [Aeromicrobium chenweiae]|uniref:RecBCD enzyme subunit RecB n=1 Tax=Aeromicrobium chenweiae TaxID=2079793 RepID=A0A2S0WMV8_9ACTN|nr:UvrD-helicase domain-containing protein [Aeromicrobium chenweiae]AWB92678.1 exodeoxyribonuclease V subunit beta [Aeromicrobium chenweiae]TGN33668.1 exodeoxyribonuclease V subunit beta [Aeromicrobium chenweiae]
MRAFSIRDPLPQGTTLLEASAGTGKTWTVGALVTRYVAEGVASLDELLIITFGRAASRELRERVREQLVEAERKLADPVTAKGDRNEVIALLVEGSDEVVAARRQRLRAALADFDGATIATTHQFCQLVLRSLGTAGDADANAELVESLDDVLVQVVDDLYLQRFRNADPAPFSIGDALSLARSVVGDPQARLLPDEADPSTLAGTRVGFALAVRDELDRRKRALGLLGYDDLLSRLAVALEGDDAPARDQMRRRWKVVLVDEFQDTDPVQWQVLERAFGGHATLVLIGDPKQAIYAFRGGDVVTYLDAAGTAAEQATLSTNWRSDAALVTSLLVPFEGAALGDERIVVHPVGADQQGSRLTGDTPTDPFRLRVLTRYDVGAAPTAKISAPAARNLIAEDLAGDITAALAGGTRFDGRPLTAGDIAVLVYSHPQAGHVQRVLAEHGVAAVLAGGTNVFRSAAGDAWLTLLEAMERPQSSARVRAAGLTDFMGHSAAELAASGDALTDELATRVREQADLLRDRGIAAVFEATSGQGELARRVLQRPDGRRRMTDLRHIAQALHEAAEVERLGPGAMLAWLRAQRDDASAGSTERTRRLDSDAAAVQIVTVHASKGLQYPVVYLPFLFDRWIPPVDVPRFHAGTERVLDIGGKGSNTFSASERTAKAEDCAEQLRLLYVAATRAQSQVVAWWAPSTNAHHSALTRLLFGRKHLEAAVPDVAVAPSDEEALQRLKEWESLGGPVVERAAPRGRTPLVAQEPVGDLAIRSFDRVVDTTWRRTSYTGLTRDDHAVPTVDSEVPDIGTTDEEAEEVVLPVVPSPGASVPSPMADLPMGAAFGSLVHGVLEQLDVTTPDLREELLGRVRHELAYWGVDADPDELADALVAVCRTPLGPLADDLTLETLLATRQLRELDFELPLAGGDNADARAAADEPRLGDIALLLEQHLATDDPMRAFADRLRSPGLAGQGLRGYLSGSIDLTLRLPDGRVLVVDYKTNWLGDFREPLTLDGYSPTGLAAAMNSGTYPLQSLLYSVVIHRYLRWRQPGYDPQRHLGGILYLYVRGMAGPETPRDGDHPYGVFAWHPPAALVEALSDLMDGAAR